ncbi:MAG: energy transducer TonB [Myxococcales bacterium]
MNALGPEPESGGRLGRMGIGLGIALALGLGLVFGADHIVPTKRLLAEVLPITMVEDRPIPPKKEEEPPPPPPPPLEAPKPKPQKADKPAPAEAPPPDAPPPPSDQPQQDPVGLDADSFGAGSGGAAFHVGTSQMGTPGGFGRGGVQQQPTNQDMRGPGPRLVEARARPGNAIPAYSDRARRRNIQGMIVIEADIDESGHVTRAVVRGKVDPELDAAALKAVKTWSFEPATLAGKAVASTKFLKFRFELN